MPLGQRRHEVGQALALDGGDDRSLVLDGVVTGGQRPAAVVACWCRERPRVALVAVDEDLQHLPDARCVGSETLGRACFVVRALCQKITSRPRAWVNTNCERFSRRGRARGRSAAPRRTQDRTGTRSTMSGVLGPPVARWQYTLAVRGQASRTFSTTPFGPSGSRTRYGSDEPSSGLRAITNSATGPVFPNPVHLGAQRLIGRSGRDPTPSSRPCAPRSRPIGPLWRQ